MIQNAAGGNEDVWSVNAEQVVPIQNSESSVKRRTGIFNFSDCSTQQPKASLFFSMPSSRRYSGALIQVHLGFPETSLKN